VVSLLGRLLQDLIIDNLLLWVEVSPKMTIRQLYTNHKTFSKQLQSRQRLLKISKFSTKQLLFQANPPQVQCLLPLRIQGLPHFWRPVNSSCDHVSRPCKRLISRLSYISVNSLRPPCSLIRPYTHKQLRHRHMPCKMHPGSYHNSMVFP
jgi:hypothetical protein